MNPETQSEYTKEELAILSDQEVPDAPAAENDAPEPQPEPEPAPAEPEVKPEIVAEPKPEPAPKTRERKTVPLAELIEERKARQALEEQIKQESEKRVRLEGAFQTLNQRLQPKPEEPKPQPTVDTEPVEVLRQTQAQVDQLRQTIEAQQIQAQFSNHVRGLAEQFKAKQPDYGDALRFVSDHRRNELKLYGMTDQQIDQQLQRDEYELSAAALLNNRNPAEVIYGLAQQRGYKKTEAAAMPQISNQQQRNGPDLATIERGQAAARSLGNAGGAAPETVSGLDRLAAMTPDELGKLSESEFRKIMGG